MAIQIHEFFGYPPGSAEGQRHAREQRCPFVNDKCIKPTLGACSLRPLKSIEPVICCPNRLYASNFAVLDDIASMAFGPRTAKFNPRAVVEMGSKGSLTGNEVAVFGKYWGGELPLPKATQGNGSYYLDYILGRLNKDGALVEMTAVEVQTIDTTGSYRDQCEAFFKHEAFTDFQGRTPGFSNAGFNWENVNKRILPQVIYKGHVLRRESKCTKGSFFVCPKQVVERIYQRLGGKAGMHEYPVASGNITFVSYGLIPPEQAGQPDQLVLLSQFTTTVDQVALAFTAPRNLPPAKVFEEAINAALKSQL